MKKKYISVVNAGSVIGLYRFLVIALKFLIILCDLTVSVPDL